MFYLFINVLIIVLFFYIQKKKNNKITKVCICTIGKKENLYIREFVTYYEKFGVDKIYLYDNNDEDNEHFEDVIADYIDKGFVKILNWRNIESPQFKAIEDCYLNYNKYYNWLIFFDIDEYIHLYNFNNIKDYLNQQKFNRCKKICLNWVLHTDNEKIYYENLSLFKRFPDVEKDAYISKKFSQRVKSIVRGNISNFIIANNTQQAHIITESVKGCNGFGKKINFDEEFYLKNSDSKYYYIDHFYSKSLEEFINKIKRGFASNGKNEITKLFKIIKYFSINKLRNNKFLYIIKELGINLKI